ncbi:acetyl-CoA synthetase-like protein [Rhizodiscina lignyota]|uniref:Acetyl-CoA synthetase-like protein n=1 Tax=Rhizodiscina lignyota TaxID=1504668 RepID=A0A9P4IBE4_9PEZI|nr:acetyl-CoA synthetase-like protein [Rhizodiscina lignyota]
MALEMYDGVDKRNSAALVDQHAIHRPETVLYTIFLSQHLKASRRDVTAKQFADAVDRAAGHLRAAVGPAAAKQETRKIAYIGPNDLRYVILMFAAVKVNCVMLYLSPRNSLEAQIHLIDKVGCSVFATPAKRLYGVDAILKSRPLEEILIPELEAMLDGPAPEHIPFTKDFEDIRRKPLVILHSSGTTSLPKPIGFTHGCMSSGMWGYLDYKPKDGLPVSVSTSYASPPIWLCAFPLFHAAALLWATLKPIYLVQTLIFPPPDQIVNADLCARIISLTGTKAAVAPPAILVELQKDVAYYPALRQLQNIATSGAHMPLDAGNNIQALGPNISNFMASTETSFAPCHRIYGDDWQYIWFIDGFGVELQQDPGTDLYELVYIRDDRIQKERQAVFDNFPRLQEYRTKDLFRRHPDPQKSYLWMYAGRKDDVIALVNGEKFNPLALEEVIDSLPEVTVCAVFGQDRDQAVLLVDPNEKLANDPNFDDSKYADDLWPAVAKANELLPAHGRIQKGFILVTKHGRPIIKTPKGSLMRRKTFEAYEKDLDEVYRKQGSILTNRHANGVNGMNGDASVPVTRAEDVTASTIRQIIHQVTDISGLEDDQNIFMAGVDSLHVIRLAQLFSNTVLGSNVTSTTIYNNPTIAELTEAVRSGVNDRKVNTDEIASELLSSLSSSLPLSPRKVAILTGSTGNLGSYLLSSLRKSFDKIYCLVRRNAGQSDDQVVYLPYDVSHPLLGFSFDQYTTLLHETTHILHNAWLVDFNQPLQSFIPHIHGVKHLIDFASRGHHSPRIFFISSISAVMDHPSPALVPETISSNIDVSQLNAYGASKHIAERLLTLAGERSGIQSTILRLGQIAGPVLAGTSVSHGVWNIREWLPSIIASSEHIGAIPDELGLQDGIDWIPIDILAPSITEILLGSKSASITDVIHLSNPTCVSWRTILPGVIPYLDPKVKVVSLAEWVRLLQESGEGAKGADVDKNPGIKLLEFYKTLTVDSKGHANGAAKILPVLKIEKVLQQSHTMQKLGPVTPEWMALWMEQWGFRRVA